MRAFTTLIIVAALALSANAASVNKREITAPVQLCINDITAVANQLALVSDAVNTFTSADGYPGALGIHEKEQALEKLLKKAGTDCCVTPPTTVNDEEANAVLGVVSNLVPKVTSALSAISTKKSQFDAILFATSLVKTDIKNLNTQTVTLDNCLLAKTPANLKPTADEYVVKINTAFSDARKVYGI